MGLSYWTPDTMKEKRSVRDIKRIQSQGSKRAAGWVWMGIHKKQGQSEGEVSDL